MVVDRNVAVPMRDGVVLRADVYRPDTSEPVAAIVNRTPYDRSSPLIQLAAIEPERVVDEGFALVCQDVRGRFESEGDFYTFYGDREDTYDTVEWTAAAYERPAMPTLPSHHSCAAVHSTVSYVSSRSP